MILGGGQENGMRAGTENTPMIAGLGAAAEIATMTLESNSRNMKKTRDHLLALLKNIFEDVQWISAEPVLPNTLLVSDNYFFTRKFFFKGLHPKIEARNRSKIEITCDIFHWCCMSFRSCNLICTNRFRVSTLTVTIPASFFTTVPHVSGPIKTF